MESYRNTEPNPAVKGKNPGRVLKIALSQAGKKGQTPHDQAVFSAKSGVLL